MHNLIINVDSTFALIRVLDLDFDTKLKLFRENFLFKRERLNVVKVSQGGSLALVAVAWERFFSVRTTQTAFIE